MWSDLTLDGSLKECFAGLARCYAVVVAWRHIPTHQTQPLGQRAQRVLAAARSISSGALFRPIATFVFEVAAQGWRVQWRGVSFNAVSSGSPALRGIRRGPTGAGSTSPASFGAAGFCLYVDIWPTLPGRHDSWGGGETQQRNVRVNRTTFNGKKGKGFYNYLFRSIRKRLWCQSCSIVGSSSFLPQTIVKWFRFAETLKPCCEYQSCKACSVKRHVAFIALCAVAFLYCKNKAMIQENMAFLWLSYSLKPFGIFLQCWVCHE